LIVDFGPGPGIRGGKIVTTGSLNQIADSNKSLTGQYISGNKEIEIPRQRRKVDVNTLNDKKKIKRKRRQ
jgi:excinuclease ABC subunit A